MKTKRYDKHLSKKTSENLEHKGVGMLKANIKMLEGNGKLVQGVLPSVKLSKWGGSNLDTVRCKRNGLSK
jgi:hypothetical protein